MPNPLQAAGAALPPSDFAPLHINRMTTGLWTNSNPLRDAATTDYVEKYYGGKQDRIIAGINCEISPRLTLVRRAGLTVYNSQNFPPIRRFYGWNTFTQTDENVRVMADTAATVYDATGPNTKNAIWQKSPGAGPTYFLGVGNTLYFTNGVDNKQWLIPTKKWIANTRYYVDDTVLDSNGNIERVMGFNWMGVNSVSVTSGANGKTVVIKVGSAPAFLGKQMRLVGDSVPGTTGVTFLATSWQDGGLTITWAGAPSTIPDGNYSGGFLARADSSGGVTGGSQPAWQPSVTGDGEIIWQIQGPNVSDWGIAPPVNAPTITQSVKPNTYGNWTPNTVFGSPWRGNIFLYDPVTNTCQYNTKTGTTAASGPPAFDNRKFYGVADGSTAWTCTGPANWQPATNYSGDDVVIGNTSTGGGAVQNMFAQIGSGNSGSTEPAWPSGLGATVTEPGGCIWQNVGVVHQWSDIGPTTYCQGGSSIDGGMMIVDPKGYLQQCMQSGKTGPNPPDFKIGLASQTQDNKAIWVNSGSFSVASTAPFQYGYAFKNSATGDISNMSPKSAAVNLIAGNETIVQGDGSTDPQVDTIIVYRTEQGGSTFFYVGELPNPPSGQRWTFTDTVPDSGLTVEVQAQVNGEGTPLPKGATALEYHLGRIFAAVGNVVYVSSGPDAIASTSSGNAGFGTTFTLQSKITRFWVNSLGIAVFTVRDLYIILGSGTDSDPLYVVRWIENVPLLNYDALTIFLSTAYIYSGQKIVGSLDPSAGIVEASFPIANLLTTLPPDPMPPESAFLTFHTGGSGETALYLSDGVKRWFRMAPTSAPEAGINWSPPAYISGGMSCVQSTEVLPGKWSLLVGPPDPGGTIRQRDTSTHLDAGTGYVMEAFYGSIVLATPGQLAGLAWMTLECSASGTAPDLSVILDELSGQFEPVPRTRQDPTNLPPSKTVLSNRHSLLQGQNPVWCRHMRFGLVWGATDTPDELLTFTIFGQTWQEQRSQ
jgi:hypothetical protein